MEDLNYDHPFYHPEQHLKDKNGVIIAIVVFCLVFALILFSIIWAVVLSYTAPKVVQNVNSSSLGLPIE